MAVQADNYNHRGKGNWGIIVCCPKIAVPNRLVYFDYNRRSRNWVIRDFIVGYRLDNSHSSLTISDIEQDAIYDEFPPWCSVEEKPQEWKTYLSLRTTAYTKRRRIPRNIPTIQYGQWERF